MLKISQLTLALCASVILVACGGGGGGSSTGGAPVTPPTVLATTAYAGNWKDIETGACGTSSIQQTNATGVRLKNLVFINITPLTDTTISLVFTMKHYAPTDTNCSGTVLVTETLTPYVFQIDGTATINGQVVDKITPATPSLSIASLVVGNTTITGSTLGSGATTINGYYFAPGHFDVEMQSAKKIAMRVTATNLFCDNGSGTATTYPTGMDAAACFVKL